MSSTPLSPPGSEPEPPETGGPAPHGFLAELRDAVSARAVLMVVGVFVLQLGFVLSYIGAFHAPTPHRIPVAVAAPTPVADKVAAQLNGLAGDPVKARTATDEKQARALILDRTVDAAIIVDPRGGTDTLLVASAGGPAVSTAVTQIAEKVEATQHRQVKVTDIRPPAGGDGRGLSSFYLVLGWIVGGYLAAAILGTAGGARPANQHRTLIRLGALAVYAALSGIGGALIAGPLLGALPGDVPQLWAIGSLVVFAAGATTVAFQALLGTVGIGVTILVFVVLGNPSAGGAYPTSLLPPFWRTIGPWLPPGAGTAVVRNTAYFSGNATSGPLWVLGAYAVGGAVIAVVAGTVRGRRARAGLPVLA
ncbi:DUF3533 domain-containing protein [Streptomyces sp. NPDC088725]|uniref:DUF3533 domain-containing protein n=1 Tax=Streptomyces sp. NPDC088725 TaxID=3365873 RepID=UPI0038230273